MIIAVMGLWHLGSVTAACLASLGHEVIAYDSDETVIENFKNGKAPIFEPGLDKLIKDTTKQGTLRATSSLEDISKAQIIWITYDTPVDDNDHADVEFVLKRIAASFPYLSDHCLMLISSQLPVGSTKKIQTMYREQYPQKTASFACSPENLRLGKAIEIFKCPDRVIVGVQSEQDKILLTKLFEKITHNIVWMQIESAEMTKHALNAFLATSVTFINELSSLCEQVGADAREVEKGLKSEMRIGERAYLRPGSAFAGGTLARDVSYLIHMGEQHRLPTYLFPAVLDSNHYHKQWACRRVKEIMKQLHDKKIAVLGLTYKAGTNTLRRSTAVETCQWLHAEGAHVMAYDPAIKQLPSELAGAITLKDSIFAVLKDADAVVVSTEWPEFTALSAEDFTAHMQKPLVFDPSGFLSKSIAGDERIRHFTVGRIA